MRVLLLLLAAPILSGCAGSVLGDAMAGPQAIAEREDAYCQSIGLQYGTADYANCRMATGNQRQQRHQAAVQNATTNMNNTLIANTPVQMAPRQCVSHRMGNQVITDCQ